MNKSATLLLLILLSISLICCKKNDYIGSKDAILNTSVDTLHFDTVFTSTGSITNRFKIFNPNSQKLRLSSVKLMGGSASPFKMNVDGLPGVVFNNVELEPNDSLYVFVTVNINPNATNLPFIVQDSVLISYNGNDRFVQLQAYGQNANFLRGSRIRANTAWNNLLPYVILDGLTIDPGVTLTINEGTKIFAHANAPIIVNGTLKVLGKHFDSTRVTFASDRLDVDFKEYPGSWPGIYFSATSTNNELTYAVIKNAYQGIITDQPSLNSNAKVTLSECIVDNIYDAGILSINSSINARNCLISNCGSNIAIIAGGDFYFNHCTVSSYSNAFIQHKKAVLNITNSNDQNQVFPLNALFRNCIFFGDSAFVKNEIEVDRRGTAPFSIEFENVLYRATGVIPAATFVNSIRNEPPLFDSINSSQRIYNFRLKSNSPAVNAGVNTGLLFDLDGKIRNGAAGLPDIGAFEF